MTRTFARTTSLFANTNFFRGMASVLDVGDTLTIYNTSESPQEADAEAIYQDWAAVGDDLWYSIGEWEKSNVG